MSQVATNESDPTDQVRPSGFRANLNGASLPDLVQMECLAQSSSVFRITSEHNVGYLYFHGGQIIHAVSGDHSGEPAALEILKWRYGTFDACNVALPETPSIHSSWQHLLLRAAQTRDESGRHTLVSFPKQRATAQPTQEIPGEASRSMPSADARVSRQPEAAQQIAVRLDERGNVVSSKGDVTELAPVVAYATRLGQLIGFDLGMDGLVAFESVSENARCLVHVEKSGHVLAVRAAAEVSVTSLRSRFGL
jgi:hypothetical protein